jgi:hypothetical protein
MIRDDHRDGLAGDFFLHCNMAATLPDSHEPLFGKQLEQVVRGKPP